MAWTDAARKAAAATRKAHASKKKEQYRQEYLDYLKNGKAKTAPVKKHKTSQHAIAAMRTTFAPKFVPYSPAHNVMRGISFTKKK